MKHIITSKLAEFIVLTFKRINDKLYYKYNVEKTRQILERQVKLTRQIFKNDYKVQRGPFKELLLPSLFSINSMILPKLIGSYENELHPLLREIIKTKFTSIVNIGAADGYYALGLAREFPDLSVHVFDINRGSTELIRRGIKLNNLKNRFQFHGKCNYESLKNKYLGKEPLLFVDCDGCEYDIFNSESVKSLKNATIIVELHGHLDVRNSTSVLELFSDSHNINLIPNETHKLFNYEELANLSYNDKVIAISECRAGFTEWAFLKPK